ncbi:MAG TPA: serine hydrolase domain-containing protein [Nevskiaceae bacterium]|nr:serine hydrolase domain-containing protein [Nevskiaceae bacterium]
MNTIRKFLLACTAAAFATGASAAASDYQPIAGASPVPATEGVGLRSKEDLEAFLDGILNAQMKEHHIAGITVSVVKDGALFFSKGYGYADVDKQTPVDPATTLFRPGSTSKLFTWTAVMQQVEQGKIDLDADVNQYVTQFKVPSTFDHPITVRNLMTHTPGLEDGALGYLMARKPEDLVPLDKALGLHIPTRVKPAITDFNDGTTASYSNWGAALAGLIVSNVSGMPFDDYIDKNILQPLGMKSSTFREPLPAELAPHMSVGYSFERGVFKGHDFELVHSFGPAGCMSATANDMANFMIAHLQNGEFNGQRILKEETAKLMHARQFSPSPHVAGSGLGFYEEYVNGRRLIGHGGDLLFFHTNMVLLPEANVGIFVSYNTAGSLPIDNRGDLIKQFMNRYFPAKLPQVKSPDDFLQHVAKYAGTYRANRHSYTKVEKMFAMFGDMKVVPLADENRLFVSGLGAGGAQFVEVAPGTFRAVDDDTTMSFVDGPDGRTHVVGPFAFIAATKLEWFETGAFHYFIIGLAILCSIIALVSALRNWKRDREGDPSALRARRIAGLLGLLQILFLVGLIVPIASLRDMNEIVYGLPWLFHTALWLPLICIPLTAAVLWFALKAWRNRFWTGYGRTQFTVIALSSAAFLWSLNFWNLLGFRFG